MDSNTVPERSMKWHKFLVNFALWAAAVLSAVSGAQLLTGSHYGDSAMTEQVYRTFGSLKSADTVFGILQIALAVLLIYTRFQLAGFKKGAPNKLTLAYALNLVVFLGYAVVVSNIVGAPFSEILDPSSTSSVAASVAMLVINRIYYGKRAHLFGDAPAAVSAPPAEKAVEACPRCGAKPEPGDAYCVNCGAKLKD